MDERHRMRSQGGNYPKSIDYIYKRCDGITDRLALMEAYELGWCFAKKESYDLIRKKANCLGYVKAESLIYDLERMFFRDHVKGSNF